ncbi:MAG: lysophospholipid acyltransferase family protein [Gammaproteobacteria bacterium]|nr:MAG: lysophospholipid acyltransferase family protein [Gammaproteobacteria bacterium]
MFSGFLESRESVARLLIGNSLRKYFERWSFVRNLLWMMEAAVFGAFLGLARLLPADRASAFGRRVMMWVGPRLDKHRIFKRNFRLAFPRNNEAEIEALATAAWGGAGGLLAEYAHLRDICVTQADTRLLIASVGDVPVLSDPARPTIFVSAHLANWEICAGGVRKAGIPVTAVYTPLQNPWLDRILMGQRRHLGCRLLPRDESMRSLIRELAKGRSIGLIMDQRVDSGVPIPFFGIDKFTTLVPARLALRHGYDLVPVRTERLDGARFRVTFHSPILPDDPAADEIEKATQMSRRINLLFEEWIRGRPEDWFCSKRRWPKDAQPGSGYDTVTEGTPQSPDVNS